MNYDYITLGHMCKHATVYGSGLCGCEVQELK